MSKRIICRIAGLSILLLFFASACASRDASRGSLKTSGGQSFDEVLMRGGMFLDQKSYDEALGQFHQAVRMNPESAKARNLRGLTYFLRKDYNRAEKDFRKAVELKPSYAEAYNNLGSAFFMKKEHEKSKNMYLKCLSLKPDSVSALYSLGTLLICGGEMEEGRRFVSRGIELDPEFLMNQNMFVANVSSSGATSGDLYFTYAALFASKGNAEKALEYLKKAEQAGFKEWHKILKERGFDGVRDDQGIKEFLRDKV